MENSTNQSEQLTKSNKTKLYLSLAFSILGICGASYFGIGLLFSLTSLILCDLSHSPESSKTRKAVIIISIIGLVINVISFIIYLTDFLYHDGGYVAVSGLK
jgi:Co/Zn/Cd efflux system component